MKEEERIIDLNGKSLGRAATEAAKILRGKHTPFFKRGEIYGVRVKVINASKLKITEKKLKTKSLKHYSGYPGGLKSVSLETAFKKDPAGVFKKTVRGMLPKNKLRGRLLKNLEVLK